MRVCYFGTYRQEYSRNVIAIDGLRANSVDVVECHVPLWSGIEDRVDKASGGWRSPRFLARVLASYARLLRAYRQVGPYDVLMLGYPGYLDAFAAWPLARLARKPLVLDVFMSIYLISEERGLTAQSPFTGSLIKAVEKLACRLPDLLISDTAEYVRFYGTLHGLAPERFRLVPTGADDRIYRPAPGPSIIDGTCRVVYYGTFIPNHGTLTIVQAAHLLADERHIHFDLIGDGPDRAEAESFVQEFGLSNVSFRNWMSPTDLSARVARADICLGVFGTTPQSLMTIQNKIYEGLAMARPVISGDSPTVRSALTHGEHIWLCERADPAALANAIRTVSADRGLQQRLSQQGHDLFRARYSVLAIGRRLANHLEAVSAGER